jgi:hypothetical protein
MAETTVDVKFGAETSEFNRGVERVRAGLGDLNEPSKSFASVLNEAFQQLSEAIRPPLDSLAMFKSSLRETAEVAGAAFAVDTIKEFITHNAELGERMRNAAAAVGTAAVGFADLSAALQAAGGDAETAQRTLERLGRNVSEALNQPTSQAAAGFRAVGISTDDLKKHANDLTGILAILAEKFTEFGDSPTKTAAYVAILGRGFDTLAPFLRKGREGIEEFQRAAREVGGVLSDRTIGALAETKEKMNLLGVAAKGLGANLAAQLSPVVNALTIALTGLIGKFSQALRLKGAAEIASDRASAARSQLDEVERQIAAIERGQAAAARGGYATQGPFAAIGKAAGPLALPQLDALRERAAELRAQIAQAEEDAREFVRSQAGATAEQPKIEVPPFDRGRERAGSIKDDPERRIREAYELFSAGERLKLQAAKGNADQIVRMYDEWLAETAAVYGKDSKQYLNLEREKLAAAQQASAARQRVIVEEQRKEEAAYKKAAEESAKSWRDATRQISDQLGSLVADVLDRTKSIVAALRDLVDSLLKDFTKSLFSSLLGGSGGAGGGLANLLFGSQGLSGALGLGSGGLFGLLGSALGLGGAAHQAADVAALWGGGGEAEVLAGMGDAAAGSGSLFSAIGSMFSNLFGFLGFAKGGIVPSAAGGWVVPHFGDSGILSVLHRREMVLPAPISEGLQAMIANGGGGGGHTINISAIDAGGVARLFSNHGSALVAALNRATRHGSALYQRT